MKEEQQETKTKKVVEIKNHGKLTTKNNNTINFADWPSSSEFAEILAKAGVDVDDAEQQNPQYWQVCARWALLTKYGLLQQDIKKDPYETVPGGKRQLVFSSSEVDEIQSRWKELVEDAANDDNNNNSSSSNDLVEWIQNGTGKSNHRTLLWSTMDIPPGLQFKLHAHPNVELIYCARGALHEIRMKGAPLKQDFEKKKNNQDEEEDEEENDHVQGPNLTSLNRAWYFDTLHEGEWLVNEVGSIHKSFTASSGNGCLLVVLWGGSHADIVPGQEPKLVNVQEAVDTMDARLGQCDDCTKWETIAETFLPESERSQK